MDYTEENYFIHMLQYVRINVNSTFYRSKNAFFFLQIIKFTCCFSAYNGTSNDIEKSARATKVL